MTRDETKQVIAAIMASYPNWKPASLSTTVDTWNILLEEYSYNAVMTGLKTYIKTDNKGFAPSIGQVIAAMDVVNDYTTMNDLQAWGLVSNALRNGIYNAEGEFNKLPPLVQQAVGSASQLHNWAISDERSIETVIQSNFMRTYNTVVNRNKEIRRMPQEVRTLISETNNRLAIGGAVKNE